MKKIVTLVMLLVAVFAANAQDSTTVPNRLLVNSMNSVRGYAIDNVDSITFARVDGDVKAAVTFQRFATGDADTVWVGIKRTASCRSFSIRIMPTNTANRLNSDAAVASYFAQLNLAQYSEDFSSGQLTGFEQKFEGNTSYTIVTLGYDQYGVPCQADRAEFTTPKTPTVGSPSVTYTVDSIGATAFTLTVTPNSDCGQFFWCQFNAGEAEQQFQQWGPMFGFANIGDMIKQFSGYGYSEATSNTWDGLKPNGNYEVYVLPTDVNGTYGDMVVIPVTTGKLGGEGVAIMDITVGAFGGDSINGYYQHVTYTPNDQAGIHHDILMTKEMYEESFTDSTILEVLQSDTNPYNPWDTSWDQVGVDDAAWSAAPSTSYVALSLAKNANDEWGTLAKVEFTTPASPVAPAKVSAPVASRIISKAKTNAMKKGVVPAAAKLRGVSLTEAK